LHDSCRTAACARFPILRILRIKFRSSIAVNANSGDTNNLVKM